MLVRVFIRIWAAYLYAFFINLYIIIRFHIYLFAERGDFLFKVISYLLFNFEKLNELKFINHLSYAFSNSIFSFILKFNFDLIKAWKFINDSTFHFEILVFSVILIVTYKIHENTVIKLVFNVLQIRSEILPFHPDFFSLFMYKSWHMFVESAHAIFAIVSFFT